MMQESKTISKPKVILLDVYGTLLNLAEVERKVNALMDSKRAYIKWFDLFMQYCFVDNCTNQFNDFLSIAKATMQMTARMFGEKVSDYDIMSILELLKHVPLEEAVPEGLSLLYDNNFRIAALTNSPRETVLDRMERTGLISYFEIVFSAENIRKYKPCIDVYTWAAKKLKVAPAEILLVSAHGWDIMGAANAGMQTAYFEKENEMLYPLAPAPTFIFNNLADLGRQLL